MARSSSSSPGRRLLALALALGAATLAQAYIKDKPDFIKTCYHKKPDFEDCNRQTVQGIFDKLSQGYPEIGLLPTDPLRVSKINIFQGNDGPVTINASLNDVIIRGLSGIKVIKNKVDFKTYSFATEMQVPDLRVEGNYTLKGRVLLLPLVGRGDAWFEPQNMRVMSKQTIVLKEHDGHLFFDVKRVDVTYEVSSLKMRLNNLYNGRKILEDSTNNYINNNWRAVGETLQPILERTCADIVYTIMKKLFDETPAEFYIADVGEH
ncbi:circadian clock-controlled protein daywake-like [Bacillus rossius redtenbacheri]|uniref:circadian clock-controlled protein daywake-like n=1 Tax=Bacillus rossius redtenbacheri TaxID=93214 RepID=UPI002FDECEE8